MTDTLHVIYHQCIEKNHQCIEHWKEWRVINAEQCVALKRFWSVLYLGSASPPTRLWRSWTLCCCCTIVYIVMLEDVLRSPSCWWRCLHSELQSNEEKAHILFQNWVRNGLMSCIGWLSCQIWIKKTLKELDDSIMTPRWSKVHLIKKKRASTTFY